MGGEPLLASLPCIANKSPVGGVYIDPAVPPFKSHAGEVKKEEEEEKNNKVKRKRKRVRELRKRKRS